MAYGLILSDKTIQSVTYPAGIFRSTSAHSVAHSLREQGHEIDVVDFVNNFSVDEIIRLLQLAKTPTFICFTSTKTQAHPQWNEIKDYIRATYPELPIIVFGTTTIGVGFVDADYYVEGYDEVAMPALINFLVTGQAEPVMHTINGCKVINADKDYPVDTRKLNPHPRYLESDFVGANEIADLEISRGCTLKCSFCDHSLIGRKKFEFQRTDDDVVDQLIYNYTKFGLTKYFVTDATFNDVPAKADSLLAISKRLPFKLQLLCFIRADLLSTRPDELKKLVDAGLIATHFGIESFNHQASRSIGKGMNPDKLKQFLISIKKEYPSLFIFATFIAGLPNDSKQGQYDTFDWLCETKAVDSWWWHPLSIKKPSDNFEIISDLSTNHPKFGYSQMTAEEGHGGREIHRGIRSVRGFENLILWENSQMNFYQAVDISNDLNKKSSRFSKKNPWAFFPNSTVYEDMDWWLNQPDKILHNVEVEEAVKENTRLYIEDYKQKKISYFEQTR